VFYNISIGNPLPLLIVFTLVFARFLALLPRCGEWREASRLLEMAVGRTVVVKSL